MAERKWYENPDAFKKKESSISPRSEGPRDYVLRTLSKLLGDDNKAMRLAIKLEPVLNSPQFLYDLGKDSALAVSHALNGQYEAAKDSGVNAGLGALGVAAPAGLGMAMKGMSRQLDNIPRAVTDYIPSSNRAVAAEQFMEGSKAPPMMYMGRAHMRNPGEAVTEFSSLTGEGDANVAGWAAYEPRFAERFAGQVGKDDGKKFLGSQDSTPAIYPLKVRATNPFDIAEPEHRKLLDLKDLSDDGVPESYSYHSLEKRLKEIREKGFDSYYDYEDGTHDLADKLFYPGESIPDSLHNDDYKKVGKPKKGTYSDNVLVNYVKRNKPTGIAVFNSSQLKSPFAEKFDPRDKNIGRAKGGAVEIDDGNPAKRRKLI